LRYRRRCDCPGTRTVTAPPAANPIPKGRLTSEFLARLLYEKYVLGLPVHRIVRSLAAAGLRVSEGTLCGALKAVADLLLPLEQAIVGRNAQAVHVHVDETGWRVFAQTEGKQGHRWWLWVFLTQDTVVFTMDPTRSADVVDRHFGIDRAEAALPQGRRLVLSTDFYSAYQSLARVAGVDPLWCGPTSADTSSGPATRTPVVSLLKSAGTKWAAATVGTPSAAAVPSANLKPLATRSPSNPAKETQPDQMAGNFQSSAVGTLGHPAFHRDERRNTIR
ncbi:MAG: IS66 family transposase, partial [Pseudonocardiaceae bacterium]